MPDYADNLAKQSHNLGWVLYATSRFQEAEQAVREAVRIHKQLAREHPEKPGYGRDLATHYILLGVLLQRPMRLDEAKQACEQAVLLQKQLAESFPQVPGYQHDLAGGYINLAYLQQPPEAIRNLRSALRILEPLVLDFPGSSAYKKCQALAMLIKQSNSWTARSNLAWMMFTSSRSSRISMPSAAIRGISMSSNSRSRSGVCPAAWHAAPLRGVTRWASDTMKEVRSLPARRTTAISLSINRLQSPQNLPQSPPPVCFPHTGRG